MRWDNAHILLSKWFSFWGTENPINILEIMREENYIQILDENMKESAEKL